MYPGLHCMRIAQADGGIRRQNMKTKYFQSVNEIETLPLPLPLPT